MSNTFFEKPILREKENNKKVFVLGGTTNKILQKSITKLNEYSDIDYIVDGYCPDFGFEDNPIIIGLIIEKIRNSNSGLGYFSRGTGFNKDE